MTYVVRCGWCGAEIYRTEEWEVALDAPNWLCFKLGCEMAGPHIIDAEHAVGAA